jgi:hypothetical protein
MSELNRSGATQGATGRLGAELAKAQYEPLLPIEKKLVAWSLGIGIVSLAVLAIVVRWG